MGTDGSRSPRKHAKTIDPFIEIQRQFHSLAPDPREEEEF